jgi:chemotaxis response regulator CheB
VCLGGSAGALEAYKDILRLMSADTGMAFVIAAHRGLELADLLPKILAAVTTMPVIEVEEGMRLEPNCVYLMPPGKDMEMNVDKFTLRPSRKQRGWPATITHFLFSLAEVYGRRAVAVILSGMDRDGTAALKTIKGAGGITFAQSKASLPALRDLFRETDTWEPPPSLSWEVELSTPRLFPNRRPRCSSYAVWGLWRLERGALPLGVRIAAG